MFPSIEIPEGMETVETLWRVRLKFHFLKVKKRIYSIRRLEWIGYLLNCLCVPL